MERAATHAKRAGFTDPIFAAWFDWGRYHGTTPISEFLARQDEQSEQERRNPWLRQHRAGALAMLGRFAEARALHAELRAELADLGSSFLLAASYYIASEVELLAGDPAAAVAHGEEESRLLEELGQPGLLSSSAGSLAQAYYAFGRLDEASASADRGAELGAGGDDAWTEMLWRQAKAKVLACRGHHSEAERLARQAVEISAETESLNGQGAAFADLAEVLELAGRREDAAEALEQALERYERKENLVMAERMRARLAEAQLSDSAERA
jgi:tetratricopeptide (TPR) repeat protein